MAEITHFITHTVDVEDRRDLSQNIVRDTIKLKTSERVTWTQLRRMRPVPQWNQEHSREPGFYLDFIKPKQTSRLVWELEAEYTLIKGGQINPDPTQRPPIVTFNTSLIEQPTFFDKNKRAMTTTAGEFITGIPERVPLIDYTVVKNFSSDPRWLQTHLGSVNADTVTLRGLPWEPKTLLLAAVSAGEYTTENRVTYSEFRITIMADRRTWTHKVWNRGTVELYERVVHINGRFRSIWSPRPILRGTPPAPTEDLVPLDERGVSVPDYVQQNSAEPIRPGRLIILNFETQKDLAFRNVLPV